MDWYASRVCWNTFHWRLPTGEARALESNSYASAMGFGHEEWLFAFEWMIDGRKFAYLQPVANSRSKLEGQAISIDVWSINADRQRVEVGRLNRCRVLSESEASDARAAFLERGWLAMMEAQLATIDADVSGLHRPTAVELFNISFEPADADLFEYNAMPVLDASHPGMTTGRYRLMRMPQPSATASKSADAPLVPQVPLSTTPVGKSGSPPGIVRFPHNKLQNDLGEFFNGKDGRPLGLRHQGFVDFKVNTPDGTWLFEVKTSSSPLMAVREALGQILEYAFQAMQLGESVTRLIIAAPIAADARTLEYLAHLRNTFLLPVEYLHIPTGLAEFKL